jgi:hypothetical protein
MVMDRSSSDYPCHTCLKIWGLTLADAVVKVKPPYEGDA